MRRLRLMLIALIATSSGGLAENTAFRPALSCRVIANMVASSEAVVLSAGGDRFDRYVSDQRQCALGEAIAPAWPPLAAPTSHAAGAVTLRPEVF